MTTGEPFLPFYCSTIEQGHQVVEYVKNMAYLPTVPPTQCRPSYDIGQSPEHYSGPLRSTMTNQHPDVLLVSFAPLNDYQPSTFDMTGPQEIEDNCILDEDTAYAPAAHCAIMPRLSRNQAAESGICYVCHAGGAEGEFWVGCGNLGRHTEVDGWAHGTCVGFNRPPGPEGMPPN